MGIYSICIFKVLSKHHGQTLRREYLGSRERRHQLVTIWLKFRALGANLVGLIWGRDLFFSEVAVIDKELLKILACPACKGEVFLDEAKEKIVCKACGKRYPIRDGIPVMLIEEAEEK